MTQNSPSSPQNSVSSLLRNSTLETVFRPFPNVQEGSICKIQLSSATIHHVMGCCRARQRLAKKKKKKKKKKKRGRKVFTRADLWEVDEDSNVSVLRVQQLAWTSSLNCPSCSHPYQPPHSLNASPLFTAKKPFCHWKVLRLITFPKIGSYITSCEVFVDSEAP